MIFPRRIYDLGLSHKAVAVYCYLANRADKNGECFPLYARIAEDLSNTQKHGVSCIYGT